MKIWKWLDDNLVKGEVTLPTFAMTCFTVSYITFVVLFISAIWPSEPPTTTTCNHTAEIQRLIDTIDEQGQLIGVYEFRYRGLLKIEK